MDELPELARETRERSVEPSGEAFERVVEVMAMLRAPGGCPWDREQTHATLARHLLEETYETLEAIDSGDLQSLREELGDLVLQVVFHAEIAFEEDAFTIADVLDDLRAKLVRRHPHVFPGGPGVPPEQPGGPGVPPEQPGGPGVPPEQRAMTAEEVLANWERSKREEKGTGVMDGVPAALPALARAAKLHRRALQAGFGFQGAGGFLTKLDEELGELRREIDHRDRDDDRVEAELGDVLFMVASLAQHLDVEPETALRKMLERFERRFRRMESMAASESRDLESLSSDEWGRYWEQAKQELSQ